MRKVLPSSAPLQYVLSHQQHCHYSTFYCVLMWLIWGGGRFRWYTDFIFFTLKVGGIKPGCFKIGNTGGMLDNILASKLYRPGSVAYVSRSGGMSNELNNIISRTTDGVFEGVAIGGDRLDVNLKKMVVLT